jgi:hypothetical protein
MSLLSELLNHMPPSVAGAEKPAPASRTTDRPRLVLVERPTRSPPSLYTNAAAATPEWRQARDLYVNHIMSCRSCYSPAGRHCRSGAELRATYDQTPMEKNQ